MDCAETNSHVPKILIPDEEGKLFLGCKLNDWRMGLEMIGSYEEVEMGRIE